MLHRLKPKSASEEDGSSVRPSFCALNELVNRREEAVLAIGINCAVSLTADGQPITRHIWTWIHLSCAPQTTKRAEDYLNLFLAASEDWKSISEPLGCCGGHLCVKLYSCAVSSPSTLKIFLLFFSVHSGRICRPAPLIIRHHEQPSFKLNVIKTIKWTMWSKLGPVRPITRRHRSVGPTFRRGQSIGNGLETRRSISAGNKSGRGSLPSTADVRYQFAGHLWPPTRGKNEICTSRRRCCPNLSFPVICNFPRQNLTTFPGNCIKFSR